MDIEKTSLMRVPQLKWYAIILILINLTVRIQSLKTIFQFSSCIQQWTITVYGCVYFVLVWSVCTAMMNGCQPDSITLKVRNEPCFCSFDLGDWEKWKTHSVAIYEKMLDTQPHKQGCVHTHIFKCQRGNELLIREYAPERSTALINFVPASDKERRVNMVNLVSLETSTIQMDVTALSLCRQTSVY